MDASAYGAAAQRGYEAAVHYLASLMPRFPNWTAEELATVHDLYFGELYPHAGEWRQRGQLASFGPYVGADFQYIEAEMRLLLQQCQELTLGLDGYEAGVFPADLLRFIAFFHARLIFIHPFKDGNGRWARLLTSALELHLISAQQRPLLPPLPKPVYIHALGCAPQNLAPLTAYYAEHRGLSMPSLQAHPPPLKVQVTFR
ncbi:Fic family protein [Prosthecobacter sp.]|uniref:Fic family protein n=1 Tax=Prosthecobacter sp. TaxID=1965333 RepID=UPI0037842DC1